jgi:hypothetical protein
VSPSREPHLPQSGSPIDSARRRRRKEEDPHLQIVDTLYAALQAQKIINIALHREYSAGIVFIFFQGRKDLYHV